MKLLSRKEYLKLALEESYGVQKADNKVYLIADTENNENEKALYPVRIEEFSHWELRNGECLREGTMRLRGEMCGGITFNEESENAHEELLKYLNNPIIIYAENDLETQDILKVIPDGDYIIVIGDEAPINEFDSPTTRSKNYMAYRKAISSLSVQDVVKAVNRLATVSAMVSDEPEWEDATNDVLYPFQIVIGKLLVGKQCPKCGKELFRSDLPQYDYLCIECNENF